MQNPRYRRLLKEKIIALKKELAGVRKHRGFQRRSRKKLGLPVIALVGYTNAGKSTLLNTLTRAGVMAENMLFATLDPTTRKVKLSGLKVCSGHGRWRTVLLGGGFQNAVAKYARPW